MHPLSMKVPPKLRVPFHRRLKRVWVAFQTPPFTACQADDLDNLSLRV